MKYICIVLLVFLIHSCDSSKVNNTSDKADFPKAANNKLITDNLYLTEIIPLETSDNCLISSIKRIIKSEELIIILDINDEVLFFSKKGRFLHKISDKGTGPNEYLNIIDMTIDVDNNNLILYSEDYKLHFYDLDGNNLTNINTNNSDRLFECIMYDRGNVLFYNSYQPDDPLIHVYSLKTNRFIKDAGTNDYAVPFFIRPNGRPIVKSKSIWYINSLDNHLSDFNKNDKYRIEGANMDESKSLLEFSPSDFQSILKKIDTRNICYSFSSVRETSRSIFFKSNVHGLIWLNKLDNKIIWSDQILYDSNTGLKNLNYYPHDADDNKIMFIADTESFSSINENALIIKKNIDVIRDFEMTKDSNPILLFYEERQ
jgi:hypothetical protein